MVFRIDNDEVAHIGQILQNSLGSFPILRTLSELYQRADALSFYLSYISKLRNRSKNISILKIRNSKITW